MESQEPKVAAEQNATRPHARLRTPGTFGRRKAIDVKRAPSEATTLVCAVFVAVALGVACGAWINARLASAAPVSIAPVTVLAPANLLPAAGATEQKAPATPAATEHAPAAHDDDDQPEPPGEAAPIHASVEPTEAPERETAGTPNKEGDGKRGGAAAAPAANKAARRAETAVRHGSEPEVERGATVGRGGLAPCALYASAASLAVRGGGAAALVVGGPGETGRVSVTTPDWSDIAVFYEGRAAKGWLRYSVRSVSQRPGAYTVRLTTPCGSRTIPVKVTRP